MSRKIPLHPSTIRPMLLGGAEREITLVNAVLSFALVFYGTLYISVFVGMAIAAAGLFFQWAARIAGKKDPMGLKVFRRHIHYQTFYPAAAHPDAPFALPRG
jgi:type IV secretory pathway TrbD component